MSTEAVAGAVVVLDPPDSGRGLDGEDRSLDETSVDRRLGEATHTVPAHLRLASVGVAQLHREVGAVTSFEHPDHPVRADAVTSVAQRARQTGVDR